MKFTAIASTHAKYINKLKIVKICFMSCAINKMSLKKERFSGKNHSTHKRALFWGLLLRPFKPIMLSCQLNRFQFKAFGGFVSKFQFKFLYLMKIFE